MPDAHKNQKKNQPSPPVPQTPAPEESRGLDLVVFLMTRFGRFGWDILGVALLAFALMTALALLGLQQAQGALLGRLAAFLLRWLGWGSWMVVLASGLMSFAAFRKKTAGGARLSLGRILALEGAFFSALALLSVLGGSSIERAEAGQDAGGVIGWGLAEMLFVLVGSTWRGILAGSAFVVFLAIGLGFPPFIEKWIEGLLGIESENTPPLPATVQSKKPEVQAAVPPVSKPAAAVDKKPTAKLPPEYRKTLVPPSAENEKPSQPQERASNLPPMSLLINDQQARPDDRHINLTAGLIEKTLNEFGVPAKVVGYRIGPTVTQYAVEPGFIEKVGSDGEVLRQKVRVSQISALVRDLTLALSAERLRIEAPVPGRSYVGIEVPNQKSSMVRLRSIMESTAFQKISSPLAVALGRDVSGQPVVADLARMPHLLIAGTTGSGKSVCIAALTACLVANNTPDTLRIAMIDPKMVELVRFNGVPHLLGKVETDLERILGVLRWALNEMDHRYRLLEQYRVREIDSYNRKMQKRNLPQLPRIVVMIDELADLMMSAPDQTEQSLVRLAQMARAVGIHLVVATQRPSTDVITGLIKANFPARISFTVASSIDSRVILDSTGAETLLGRGDMLFLNPEVGSPQRSQGVYVTDQELEKLIAYWEKALPVDGENTPPWEELLHQSAEGGDELIKRAVTIVKSEQHASASLLQRRLRIGYPRAARLIDELEDMGIIGPSQGGGKERDVLVGPDEDDGSDEGGYQDNQDFADEDSSD